MFSLASKLLLTISAMGAALAVGYGLAVDERSGVILFVFLVLAASVAAVALGGANVPDLAPFVAPDAPPPQRHATSTAPPARGTGWSLAAAAAVTVLAVGAAISPDLVIAGAVLVIIAIAGWFARVWSEHATWTPRVSERVRYRFVVPVGLPVATVVLALAIAGSVSRILLAVSKEASVVVALVVAVVILVACAWVASRPHLGSSVVVAMGAVAVASMVGAGISGAVAGEREFHPHEEHEGVIHVEARDIKFSRTSIAVPAGKPVVIDFVNRDDVYHNVAVYQGEGPLSRPVFNGEGFLGDAERTYEFDAPDLGAYTFVCDFHENMKGTFLVQPGE